MATYISETCQKERRGILLAAAFVCFTCGNAVIFILNLFMSWRGIVAVQIAIAICGFIQLFCIPETKYWHLVNGDTESAKESMLWFQPDLTCAEVDHQIKVMQQSLESSNNATGQGTNFLQNLKNKKVRKPLWIGLFSNLFRSGEGRIIFSVYFFDIFQDLDVPYNLKKWTAYYGMVYLICIIGVVAITRALNRKTAVYLWAGMMIFCLVIMILYKFLHNSNIDIFPPWIPVICGYAYFLFSMSGLYSAIFSIITEIQVAYCRPQMTAILNGEICLCFTFYAFLFPYVRLFLPIEYIFLIFLTNLIIVTIIICVLVPETSSFEFYDTLDKPTSDQC